MLPAWSYIHALRRSSPSLFSTISETLRVLIGRPPPWIFQLAAHPRSCPVALSHQLFFCPSAHPLFLCCCSITTHSSPVPSCSYLPTHMPTRPHVHLFVRSIACLPALCHFSTMALVIYISTLPPHPNLGFLIYLPPVFRTSNFQAIASPLRIIAY